MKKAVPVVSVVPVVPVAPSETHISVKPPSRTWRRVSVGVFGIAIMLVVWRWAVNHLYTLPDRSIAAFASLTVSLFYTVSVIVVFIVTGLTFFSWTASSSIASSVIQQLTTSKKDDAGKKGDK